MSNITFKCQWCAQSLEAEDDMAGDVIDCPSCNRQITVPSPRKKIPYPPQRRSSSPSNAARNGEQVSVAVFMKWLIGIIALVVIMGFAISAIKSCTKEFQEHPGVPRVSSPSPPVAAAPSVSQQASRPFPINIGVLADVSEGIPQHSITFELYVNGAKVQTMDSTDSTARFQGVLVRHGDHLFARALWRNGFNAVGMVDESLGEYGNGIGFDQVPEASYFANAAISEKRKRHQQWIRSLGSQSSDMYIQTYRYPDMKRQELQPK